MRMFGWFASRVDSDQVAGGVVNINEMIAVSSRYVIHVDIDVETSVAYATLLDLGTGRVGYRTSAKKAVRIERETMFQVPLDCGHNWDVTVWEVATIPQP